MDGCEEGEKESIGEIIAMNHSFHGRSLGSIGCHRKCPLSGAL